MPEHSHAASVIPCPPVWAVAPFLLLLLAIAVLPLVFPRFWERNRNKGLVVALVSAPIVAYYLAVSPGEIPYHLEEYFSFLVLLWSLYTISGGIVLQGNLAATPGVNTAILAVGAVAANIFGTTGASMLLIRPLLRTNMERRNKAHTPIFFIFIVSNIGGCLTPLGDPPLYMGFLYGVPFGWTLSLWPEWLFMNAVLLGLYYLWDRRAYAREAPADVARDETEREALTILGRRNVALIAGVLAAIALGLPTPWREATMIGLGALSIATTPREYREANCFSWGAIIEVAVLFAGIFVTMIPALVLLEQRGGELGVTEPWQFFWTSGGLSSFLDNTPTYLTFLALAQGDLGISDAALLVGHEPGEAILRAISLGAVFMGANSYIGNGPNFMVKAIAEERGPLHVRMPSFGGYLLYSGGILIPLFVVVTVLFF